MSRVLRTAIVAVLTAIMLTGCSVPPVLFAKVDSGGHLEFSYCDDTQFSELTVILESMRIVEEPTWKWSGNQVSFPENESIDLDDLDGVWEPAVPVLNDEREWETLSVEARDTDGRGFSSTYAIADLKPDVWVSSSTMFAPDCPNRP